MNIDDVSRDRYKQIRKLVLIKTKHKLNTIIRIYDRIHYSDMQHTMDFSLCLYA